jgi:hypothetical protein
MYGDSRFIGVDVNPARSRRASNVSGRVRDAYQRVDSSRNFFVLARALSSRIARLPSGLVIGL